VCPDKSILMGDTVSKISCVSCKVVSGDLIVGNQCDGLEYSLSHPVGRKNYSKMDQHQMRVVYCNYRYCVMHSSELSKITNDKNLFLTMAGHVQFIPKRELCHLLFVLMRNCERPSPIFPAQDPSAGHANRRHVYRHTGQDAHHPGATLYAPAFLIASHNKHILSPTVGRSGGLRSAQW
jgi:hypothetical protein